MLGSVLIVTTGYLIAAAFLWKAGVNRQRTPWTFSLGGVAIGLFIAFVLSLFN